MIKRIIILIFSSLLLVGCGVICKDKPPRKAKYVDAGGYGMLYHVKLYDTRGDRGTHVPTLKCMEYIDVSSNLYSDDLGNLTADNVVWVDQAGYDAYPAEQKDQMKIFLSTNKVIISGFTGVYAELNGEFPVK